MSFQMSDQLMFPRLSSWMQSHIYYTRKINKCCTWRKEIQADTFTFRLQAKIQRTKYTKIIRRLKTTYRKENGFNANTTNNISKYKQQYNSKGCLPWCLFIQNIAYSPALPNRLLVSLGVLYSGCSLLQLQIQHKFPVEHSDYSFWLTPYTEMHEKYKSYTKSSSCGLIETYQMHGLFGIPKTLNRREDGYH